MLNHTTLINLLITKNAYKSYLEIGISDRVNFNAIAIESSAKVGVDPNIPDATHKVSSDLFFHINNKTYDLIFIDGLHLSYQVYRDIINSLKVLNPGGTIVCHDVNPSTFEQQAVPQQQSTWTGDCWKAWVRLRMKRSDLDMKVIDTDYGLGIIQVGNQKLLPYVQDLDWNGLVANRVEWLNLICCEKFLEIIRK